MSINTNALDGHKLHVIGAWGLLMALTAVSWRLGADHDITGLGRDFAMISILVVTFTKIYIVGYSFMEIREAKRWLQNLFRVWCLAVGCTLCILYTLIPAS